ncbi:helix-turn-helix domain-containing protein [Streptomyces sp. SS7]|uniref:helix-turn-helix domain-containing protein n=1 Tax=Streptomyces sp. SS7 TaxID=3108485 RepID=UPI0030EE8946
MWPDLCHHPLAYVRMIRNWSQEDLARLIRQAAERRGLRNGTDRNRIWKWESGRVEEPDAFSQELLAEVLDVPLDVVAALGWPWWLPAYTLDEPLWDFPGRSVVTWSPAATVESLESVTGGPMDRRSFLIASSTAVAAAAATWAGNVPFAAASPTAGRRIGASTADLFDARLEGLRRLDDRLGSAEVHQAARAELRLITSTLKDASYSENTGKRLYAAAAEAGRICGWTAYDSSHHAAAERHYLASLRAAGHTDDRAVGATVLAFWAGLRYNRDDPHGALGILDAVTATAGRRTGSPRVTALLHARTARAHAKAGNRYGAHQAVDAAFGAYACATPADQDVPSMYWITEGELHQVAASAALDLGEHRRALEHFQAAGDADDPYDTEKEPRGTAIYLTRRAETHLALGEIDAAVDLAQQAVDRMGGTASARGSSTITALRGKLAAHRAIPDVRDFLAATA